MKEQETHADIIAEMLGARPEFPFVYLIGEPDTPEVIDSKTKKIIEPRKINIRRVTVKELACRLESAHKRECGDVAKLREAAEFVAHIDDNGYTSHDVQCAIDKARAALAATPRNCDVYTSDELKVKFKSELASELPIANEHEKNLVAITAMGVIDTLLAPATEKEGGDDGK